MYCFVKITIFILTIEHTCSSAMNQNQCGSSNAAKIDECKPKEYNFLEVFQEVIGKKYILETFILKFYISYRLLEERLKKLTSELESIENNIANEEEIKKSIAKGARPKEVKQKNRRIRCFSFKKNSKNDPNIKESESKKSLFFCNTERQSQKDKKSDSIFQNVFSFSELEKSLHEKGNLTKINSRPFEKSASIPIKCRKVRNGSQSSLPRNNYENSESGISSEDEFNNESRINNSSTVESEVPNMDKGFCLFPNSHKSDGFHSDLSTTQEEVIYDIIQDTQSDIYFEIFDDNSLGKELLSLKICFPVFFFGNKLICEKMEYFFDCSFIDITSYDSLEKYCFFASDLNEIIEAQNIYFIKLFITLIQNKDKATNLDDLNKKIEEAQNLFLKKLKKNIFIESNTSDKSNNNPKFAIFCDLDDVIIRIASNIHKITSLFTKLDGVRDNLGRIACMAKYFAQICELSSFLQDNGLLLKELYLKTLKILFDSISFLLGTNESYFDVESLTNSDFLQKYFEEFHNIRNINNKIIERVSNTFFSDDIKSFSYE